MATVTLDEITKTYKGKTGPIRAVDHMCLAVADREFVALVGPSGCGKTTTLRLVAGLEEADNGTIHIGDCVVNHVAPKDRDVAMVFQNYALYPHMTVFQNMGFGLKMRRTPKRDIKRKVDRVAAMLGIEHLLDRKPAALSGGEKQRVAVGRAIVRRPRVFLFDEPLCNLDAALRLRMRTEIKSLHQKLQTTMIYVTHDQQEAMTLADRLVVLKDGVVQQNGSPLEVYNAPANRFVAGFIGTPSMNFLEGRLMGHDDTMFFSGDGVSLALCPERAEVMQGHSGRDVVLGIRSEHMRLAETGTGSVAGAVVGPPSTTSSAIDVSITVIEPLGDRILVHGVTSAGHPIVVQAGPTAEIRPGQQHRLVPDMARTHFFATADPGPRLDTVA